MNNKIIPFPIVKQKALPTSNKVPATVRSLALALKVKLRVSSNSSLAYFLDNTEVKSNQRAIEKWLLDNYSEQDIKSMDSPLELLSDELTSVLNNKLMMMEDE